MWLAFENNMVKLVYVVLQDMLRYKNICFYVGEDQGAT